MQRPNRGSYTSMRLGKRLQTLWRAHKVPSRLVVARARLSTASDVHIIERKVRAASATTQDIVVLGIRGGRTSDVFEGLQASISHGRSEKGIVKGRLTTPVMVTPLVGLPVGPPLR